MIEVSVAKYKVEVNLTEHTEVWYYENIVYCSTDNTGNLILENDIGEKTFYNKNLWQRCSTTLQGSHDK